MAIADLPKAIEIAGTIAITETTNEARLSCAQSAGVARVQWSSLLEANTCPLCAALDGKVFRVDEVEFNPPAHINCNCIWVERGDDEVGPIDWFLLGEPGSAQEQEWVDLIGKHGHFLHDEEKYKPLRIPAGPTGRDFTFRRRRNPETGQLESVIEWKRPRYDLGDLTVGGQYTPPAQVGVAEVGERWEALTRSDVEDMMASLGPRREMPPVVAEAVDAAEEQAKTLGLKAVRYDDDPSIGATFNDAAARVRARGVDLPDEVYVHADLAENRKARGRELARRAGRDWEEWSAQTFAYPDGAITVIIDPRMAEWGDPAGTARMCRQFGLWSTDAPDHAILHELGHAAHRRSYAGNYAQLLRALTDDEYAVAEKVSERATKNPREFVGEVFAQLMTGQPVDASTLNLYRKFQGVEPR